MPNSLQDQLILRLHGKQIHRREDAHGAILVIDQGDERVLTFESIYEQSRMHKRHPTLLVHGYMRAMFLGTLFVNPNRATILGLGGGSLVRAIHATFPHAFMDVVELREAVVDVAEEFFGLPETPLLRIHIDDADFYLKGVADASTNIVFTDLYHAYGMSPVQSHKNFLRQCHRILDDNGWLVINAHTLLELTRDFMACLHDLFEDVYVCDVPQENHVLYAGKRRLNESIGSFIPRTKSFPDYQNARYDDLLKKFARVKKP